MTLKPPGINGYRDEILEEKAKWLLKRWCGEELVKIESITPFYSGSQRKYHRVFGRKRQAVLCENKNRRENEAFIYLSKKFRDKNLNVPAIYAYDLNLNIYLMEDLGDHSLFDLLSKLSDWEQDFKLMNHFKNVVSILPKFQIDGAEGLDFSKCYPLPEFNEISMKWDLNYFKYYYLKQKIEEVEEDTLENTFDEFIKLLLDENDKFFVYRDFQSRNIILKYDDYYFIDYQGGRMGALQYDLASILYSGSIVFPDEERKMLYDLYLTEVTKKIKLNTEIFENRFYLYSIFRVLQILGAYGFRGNYQSKKHFYSKFPNAESYIYSLLSDERFPNELNYLKELFDKIPDDLIIYSKKPPKISGKLKISIKSFSYKSGIPEDNYGNGGGFVFDCRSIKNPGRLDEYKSLSGKDQKVISFLESETDVNEFLSNVISTITPAIKNYIERDFENLAINFGCTGGQHRSVYCAEKTAEMIKKRFDVKIEVKHTELEKQNLS